MLTADPPEHRRFRGLVNKAFTPRRVDDLGPGVARPADELIDRFEGAGHFEVLSQFSVPLPLTVIADQLGVPRADLARFERWTDGFTAELSGLAFGEDAKEAARRIFEFQRYFAARAEEARRAPREDIISDLVRARLEGERPLDMPETLSILQQLLVAGNETTAAAIAEGLLLLMRHPDQFTLVRGDSSLVPNLVEEVLRLATPTASMFRKVTRDASARGSRDPGRLGAAPAPSTRSTRTCPPSSTCTWSSTTTALTRHRRSSAGLCVTRASICTSRRLGGALVRHAHAEEDQARCSSQRSGARSRDPRLPRALQREPEALRPDEERDEIL
jgi:hypothetical protein